MIGGMISPPLLPMRVISAAYFLLRSITRSDSMPTEPVSAVAAW
jgi:hypothetical protein